MTDIREFIESNTYISVVTAVVSTCSTCIEWVPQTLSPILEEHGIPLKVIYVDKELVPTPPRDVPTTYYYISGLTLPMIAEGPETKDVLLKRIDLCKAEMATVNK